MRSECKRHIDYLAGVKNVRKVLARSWGSRPISPSEIGWRVKCQISFWRKKDRKTNGIISFCITFIIFKDFYILPKTKKTVCPVTTTVSEYFWTIRGIMDEDVSINAVGHTIASIRGGPSLDDFNFNFDFDVNNADANDGPFLLVGGRGCGWTTDIIAVLLLLVVVVDDIVLTVCVQAYAIAGAIVVVTPQFLCHEQTAQSEVVFSIVV